MHRSMHLTYVSRRCRTATTEHRTTWPGFQLRQSDSVVTSALKQFWPPWDLNAAQKVSYLPCCKQAGWSPLPLYHRDGPTCGKDIVQDRGHVLLGLWFLPLLKHGLCIALLLLLLLHACGGGGSIHGPIRI